MQAAASGVSTHQLITEFRAAEKAKVEQFQSLQRAHKPPSYGGNPIAPPSSTISGVSLLPGAPSQQPLAPAPAPSLGGFGFGAAPAPSAAGGGGFGSSPFGQAPPSTPLAMGTTTAGFGQAFGASTTTATAAPGGGFGFGQTITPTPPTTTTTGGFGGTFGSTAPQLFGSQGKLGQQPQQQQGSGSSPFGTAAAFGQRQPPPPQQAAVVTGGFGSSAFGGTAAPNPVAITGFGQQSAFGTAAAFSSSNNSGMETQQQQPEGVMNTQQGGIASKAQVQQNDDEYADIWNAPTFERGLIPERPPPPQYVR